jgi:hypothetical protein
MLTHRNSHPRTANPSLPPTTMFLDTPRQTAVFARGSEGMDTDDQHHERVAAEYAMT